MGGWMVNDRLANLYCDHRDEGHSSDCSVKCFVLLHIVLYTISCQTSICLQLKALYSFLIIKPFTDCFIDQFMKPCPKNISDKLLLPSCCSLKGLVCHHESEMSSQTPEGDHRQPVCHTLCVHGDKNVHSWFIQLERRLQWFIIHMWVYTQMDLGWMWWRQGTAWMITAEVLMWCNDVKWNFCQLAKTLTVNLRFKIEPRYITLPEPLPASCPTVGTHFPLSNDTCSGRLSTKPMKSFTSNF